MANMARVFGDDASATPDCGFYVVLGRVPSFPHDPTDSRRTQDETDAREDLRHSLVSHRRAQALQLPHEIPDEIGISVDRLDGLNQGAFTGLVEPTHPDHESLKVDQEHLGRLLQIPASCRSELENSQSLDRGVVGPTPGPGPLPAPIPILKC
jgi:hypothetical protein